MSVTYNSTFVCAECGGIFDKGIEDEEECAAELACDFPGMSEDECDLVCDDCYKQMPIAEWREDWSKQ